MELLSQETRVPQCRIGAALIAILMLFKGVYEHRKFRTLAARLQAQRTAEE